MARFVAGVVSALLLVTAGFFLWTGLAHRDASPVAPPPVASDAVASPDAAAAAPDIAPQASEKTREEKRFARYDHDKDGKVSRDEYLASRRKAFAKLDTNGDGKLSFDEYAVKTEAKFATADADKSGTLSPTEFATTRVQRKYTPRCPPAARAAAPSPEPAGDDEGG